MRVFIVILFLIFIYSCSDSQPVSEEQPLGIFGAISFTNSAYQEDFAEIIIELLYNEQDILRRDTTDANGYFNFNNLDRGNYTLSVNNKAFSSIDTTFNLSSDTRLELSLSKKADYLPLFLGNKWSYKYDYFSKSNHDCVGVPYKKEFGTIEWTITEITSDTLYEFSENRIVTKLDPDLDGSGCVIQYDTLNTSETMSKFYLVEKENSGIIAISPEDLFSSSVIKRYHETNAPEIIDFYGTIDPADSDDYNIELGDLKREVGLIDYHYKFGSSSHHYEYYTLSLQNFKTSQ